MHYRRPVLMLALLLAVLVPVGWVTLSQAQDTAPAAPLDTAFTYHGRLVRDGTVYNGDCEMVFRLYDRPDLGMQVGAPVTATFAVVDGLFAANLDFGAGSFQGDERWLAIRVLCEDDPGFTDLPGRQPIDPAPSALRAQAAPWAAVTGVPAGFADGVDDDTQYQAGQGLTLSGGTFSVDPALYQRRVETVCDSGAAIRGIGPDGSPVCETTYEGDITSVTVITGLLGGGAIGDVTIEADPTYLQRRVEGECAAGAFINSIDATGGVTCELDSNTVYTTGNQLLLLNGELNVVEGSGSDLDADTLDGPGLHSSFFSSASRFFDGTLAHSFYSAWADLVDEGLLGNEDGDLAWSNGQEQQNLNADQLDGQHGSYLLNADHINAGTLGTDFYSAYADLASEDKLGVADGIAVNTRQQQPGLNAEYLNSQGSAYYQRRVSGICENGKAMSQIGANGTVSCSPVAGGDITSISLSTSPPSYLTLYPGDGQSGEVTVNADLALLQARVTQTCSPGSAMQEIYADGSADCQADDDSGGDISAVWTASGLTGGNSSGDIIVAADTAVLQSKVTGQCNEGYFIRQINADGTVACEADETGAMLAGEGLNLNGTVFAADSAEAQRRVTGECTGNQVMSNVTVAGGVDCVARGSALTNITAGTGLSGGGAGPAVTVSMGSWSTTFSAGTYCTEQQGRDPDPVQLADSSRSVCFLQQVRFSDNNDDTWSYCRIYNSGGFWWLKVHCEDEGNVHFECKARCFQW